MESPQAIERILTFFIHRKILNFPFLFDLFSDSIIIHVAIRRIWTVLVEMQREKRMFLEGGGSLS